MTRNKPPFDFTRSSGARRFVFFNLVIALTLLATWVLADIFWRGGLTRVEIGMLIVFVPLFGMVALGFVQAVTGFLLLWFRRDGLNLSRTLSQIPEPEALPVTAIALPIHNEDVGQVFEGLRATYLSLMRAGYHERFHFFVLSDTRDVNRSIEEEIAWVELCKQVQGFGRIFYRHRRMPLNRKSGNVSDFCRRWGRGYRYMVVLDADSVMDSRSLVRMVALMETHPQVGIIQTAPQLVLGGTFFARMMQFASSAYGPVFAAGLNFWQQAEGNYWGHNAILRVAPFMEHCALPELPITGMADARFMSHDYVEAALMRKAGFAVWLAYDLDGSYEGGPPTVIESAKRDRRWCRGNLQHAWLLSFPGIHPINRLHLALGILSYVASPLWLVFLLFGTAQSAIEVWLARYRGFDFDVGLASFLDIGGIRLALMLFLTTLAMLTVPKGLAWLLILRSRTLRLAYGGTLPLLASGILEQAVSTLLAPVQMLFHSRFVLSVLLGHPVHWVSQARAGGDGLDWRTAILTHGGHTMIGMVWALALWRIHPVAFWWMSPVLAGLCFSIPLSIVLSMKAWGSALARLRLLRSPAEQAPPPVLKHLKRNLAALHKPERSMEAPQDEDDMLRQVVLDPYLNAVHVSLYARKAARSVARRDFLLQLEDRFLREGPAHMALKEKRILLRNPESMTRLHSRVWREPGHRLAPCWNTAIQSYNLITPRPSTPLYR
jgi:membrane glycosyltransferase